MITGGSRLETEESKTFKAGCVRHRGHLSKAAKNGRVATGLAITAQTSSDNVKEPKLKTATIGIGYGNIPQVAIQNVKKSGSQDQHALNSDYGFKRPSQVAKKLE